MSYNLFEVKTMKKLSKMSRQLQLFNEVHIIVEDQDKSISPDGLMNNFGISRRMLQRDLKDFRDSGLINLKYDKVSNRYILSDKTLEPKEIATRRMQHLNRLYRIGTLVVTLSKTPSRDLEEYKDGVRYFNEYLEDAKENPKKNTPEDIEMMRDFYIPRLNFYDLKKEYYNLFPDSNERTRQRDFEEINKAGFEIYYSRKFKAFIFEEDSEY